MITHEKVNLDNKDYYTTMPIDNLSWDAHFHHAIEFCYVIDGEVDFTIDGIIYNISAGEAVITMPNQIHTIKTDVSSRIQILRIRPEVAGSFYSTYKHKIPKCSKFTFSNKSVIGNGIYHVDNIYAIKALTYMFISDLCSQCSVWIEKVSKVTLISNMINVADNYFASDISLKNIAERLNYNYSYISTEFRRIMGMTFNEYLNNCRINHACWLLKNTDLSITEVADKSGYNSIRSFNRNFLKYSGATPVEYRNSSMI